MHITLIDDSIAYDGNTPLTHPLGGTEKAVATLAPALVKRGHKVSVVNNCPQALQIDGVNWVPFDAPRPPEIDVVIAIKKPALLAEFPEVEKKLLWLATPATFLNKPKNQALLEKHNPIIVFMGDHHYRTWSAWKEFRKGIVVPGVRREYLSDAPFEPVAPKRAIVTTNPLFGLNGILDMWVKEIIPKVDEAELHIYSAGLFKAEQGGDVAEKLQPIFNKIKMNADKGVRIQKPVSDLKMSAAYREATVHIYPGSENEIYCSTLAETQALGLPCVARSLGAATERVKNGQTGFLVPDTEAMANVILHLFNSESSAQNMSRDCRLMQRSRTWDMAAVDFEALF